MKRTLPILCGLLFAAISFGFAQTPENETSLSVQIRPRAEYRNGVLMPRSEGQSAAGFINNRTRLSLNYKRSDNLTMKLSAQHVGVWGQDPQIDSNGRFILNEAWARLHLGSGFFAQLGRQGLVYDDERILGGLDWNVAGRFHDALKLGFEDASNKLHLILAYNQNGERIIGGNYYGPGAQPYKTMQTLWYQYADKEHPFQLSVLAMNLGQEGANGETAKGKTRYLQTLGTNINYAPHNWSFAGSVYYQTGKTAADREVSAWMGSLKAAYKIDSQWGLSVGTDYLSGQKEGKFKLTAFNPLYGTHHKFYGSMDYFYASAFMPGFNPGLWDLYAGLTCKASGKVNLSANYHYFQMASEVTANNEKLSKGLGSEIDLQLDWNIMKDVRLTFGYSFMLGTESMDMVKGGNHKSWQDWAWMSLNINPQVFLARW